ncbi:MAG: TetR/AcrR family transcriptional regulator [Bermanella sp.]
MKYDRVQAIEKATGLFWKLGFQGTKMRDLQEHLDMRPGSIYAGFGSKELLFKEALNHYTEQSIQQIRLCASQHDNALIALYEFVKAIVIVTGDTQKPTNCFLAKTVAELDNNNAEISLWAQSGLNKVEEEFAAVFTKAQAQGFLDQKADCLRLAKWLQVQIMGLRTYGQLQVSKEDMTDMLDHMFSSLPKAA